MAVIHVYEGYAMVCGDTRSLGLARTADIERKKKGMFFNYMIAMVGFVCLASRSLALRLEAKLLF